MDNERTGTRVIINLENALLAYGPDSRYLEDAHPALKEFLIQFPVREIVESNFLVHHTSPDQDYFVWEIIEHRFPDGCGAFSDDANAMFELDVLSTVLTDEVDELIRKRLENIRPDIDSSKLLFDHWLGPHTAVFIYPT